ncbi:PREDICTED: uncharacterized protein LOC108801440 [Nanorana parkeri]|uniref:uncharacterized protein LOC108801440 n=1 Tax=Nanorana parkeri TaxID=125878 RepID=UPI0008545AD4|nr:PREDICTED: uncharacterized protein LOC108801440 [Nanorana parkeri]
MAPCRTTTKWSMSGIAAGSSTGHADILSDWVKWFFTKCLQVEDDTQADYLTTPTDCGYQGSFLYKSPPPCLHCMQCVTQRKGGLKRLKVLVSDVSPERNVCPSGYAGNSEMENMYTVTYVALICWRADGWTARTLQGITGICEEYTYRQREAGAQAQKKCTRMFKILASSRLKFCTERLRTTTKNENYLYLLFDLCSQVTLQNRYFAQEAMDQIKPRPRAEM